MTPTLLHPWPAIRATVCEAIAARVRANEARLNDELRNHDNHETLAKIQARERLLLERLLACDIPAFWAAAAAVEDPLRAIQAVACSGCVRGRVGVATAINQAGAGLAIRCERCAECCPSSDPDEEAGHE